MNSQKGAHNTVSLASAPSPPQHIPSGVPVCCSKTTETILSELPSAPHLFGFTHSLVDLILEGLHLLRKMLVGLFQLGFALLVTRLDLGGKSRYDYLSVSGCETAHLDVWCAEYAVHLSLRSGPTRYLPHNASLNRLVCGLGTPTQQTVHLEALFESLNRFLDPPLPQQEVAEVVVSVCESLVDLDGPLVRPLRCLGLVQRCETAKGVAVVQ